MNITTEERDGFALVRVSGRVVRENQSELKVKLDEIISRKIRGVALDFEGVEYLDSAGLGCCVAIHKHLHDAKRGAMVLFNASPTVEKMWKLISLDLVIPLFPDEEAALAKLKEKAPPIPS